MSPFCSASVSQFSRLRKLLLTPISTLEANKMKALRNNRGSVFIIVTLMLVLLIFMVGMGLDTGWLTYVRSQGQAAVDASALSGASGLSSGDMTQVEDKVAAFSSTNNYTGYTGNMIGSANITLVQYDWPTGSITPVGSIATANGVRVALENQNPHTGANPLTEIISPVFLAPVANFLGLSVPSTADVNVSAVAVAIGKAGFPLGIQESFCTGPYPKIGALYSQTPSGGEEPNSSGWTTFSIKPANKPTLMDMMDTTSCAYIPPVVLGACLHMNNGQIVPVLKEAEQHIGEEHWVPVVPDVKNFNQCQTLRGWAKVRVTEVDSKGDPKYIRGDLLECILDGTPDLTEYECTASVLVRDTKSGM
jgi:Flp pilus assembly protein TadG